MEAGKILLALVLLVAMLNGCSKQPPADEEAYRAVDALFDSAARQAAEYAVVATIDHSRLAAEARVTMPPARVLIFSDAQTNSLLLQQNPLAGIDLPFKVLSHAEGDDAELIYTSAEFIQQRHALETSPALARYREQLKGVTSKLPERIVTLFDTTVVVRDAKLETLDSRYPFAETLERLKQTIMAEDDTLWFAELDYRAEARAFDIELPRLTLLLFGAPGPGGKAMAEFPRMGLDAFCQKVLVHEAPNGQVSVYYNSMVGFAELHYNDSALVHRIIDYRMRSTLGSAIE